METGKQTIRKKYSSPQILSHQPIRFETAQSWNRGKGNKDHPGHGNGGIHYPLDPRPSKNK
ncbi:hypothetical protein CF651_16530 [Paenibacillus rigui]|uniref:Uncharacterized protein n=1 Tax=Paenibacillus rigui TaxID=554312 RepID=A0A229UPA8_9BACL|nr:hypothetical protein CF651_16530 [Paenibacillus rigui]